ncbi:PadR family transcriptional regulator [Nocardioides limicola]|uniref:PadR family transcriptional regulator n=1 Tax=Nocardioides limicola TaxID=2803368 RepID=UPI00193C8077|nr:PadR family transcriptional regulator [Nocardioides sp. DJM-14]
MALEHALLVSLSERPASGLELSRRFGRSIGFFWSATHQQIYRTLAKMEEGGLVSVTTVTQTGRPDMKVYEPTDAGRDELAQWLATPSGPDAFRSDLAVRMRGASYGDIAAVLDIVKEHLADHQTRLAAYEAMQARDYPQPDQLTGADLDRYLVLRGGILMEQGWIAWLTEYLDAH